MLLESIIPTLPEGFALYYLVLAVLCGVLMVYAIFVEQEHRSDLMRLIGAAGLATYAWYVHVPVLGWIFFAIALASAVEFAEILLGLHTHSPEDLKRYKKMWRIPKK